MSNVIHLIAKKIVFIWYCIKFLFYKTYQIEFTKYKI
jgi:hypothetical protein